MNQSGEKGSEGISGPASITDFEILNGCWRQEHAELQKLCFEIQQFLCKNPDIASSVEISLQGIKATIK